ncbi:His Kinase A (phospho-acceptor) domain-containing protein [Paenibacillus sp. UNCCL117]|uniref:sensor histidine kinase n=1 Tax=unclassified Paenibacillus TaxID=185978 RepID=UPI0008825CD9|nr:MULTISPECIES: HAMP domain-containing sensor histidine kinase [unclassified Paenibacillus]SDD55973.1 His Kinase A (phospho-acceptor) domain-containing protein [Paenibacillus sp. cl123]SFW51477.1 His Kinase A (phospho-acceptor) domain-containing protein [Paenibacillus sp. UNCCL117]
MFGKTRIRLTVLNAAVFFVIIACLGAFVYTQLSRQLYANVDESLRLRILQDTKLSQAKNQFLMNEGPQQHAEGKLQKTLIQVQGIDPRVFLVLWDENGDAFHVLSGNKNREATEMFRPYRSIRTPQTVKIDGHAYRLYSMDYTPSAETNAQSGMGDQIRINGTNPLDLPQPPDGRTSSSEIVSIQAISIIDSEQTMLNNLLKLILLGIFGGGAVTLLAGLYLANKALLPIRRSWEKQQQFVADASHEVRMPLSIIQANAELVFRHPDRSVMEMSEPLSMVLAEAKRMGRLTDQLLTLARADSDQEELLLKPLLLEEVVREVTQKFEPIAELKQQKLEIQAENGLELIGDRERLHQLLVILLDNSMKFTSGNGTVRIAARRTGPHAELVVQDTGAGIAAEDLPHIFDRFYRADKSRSRSSGGTGLGLAIARWIVTRHGGDIGAASVLGQGTTMTIRLPAGIAYPFLPRTKSRDMKECGKVFKNNWRARRR